MSEEILSKINEAEKLGFERGIEAAIKYIMDNMGDIFAENGELPMKEYLKAVRIEKELEKLKA